MPEAVCRQPLRLHKHDTGDDVSADVQLWVCFPSRVLILRLLWLKERRGKKFYSAHLFYKEVNLCNSNFDTLLVKAGSFVLLYVFHLTIWKTKEMGMDCNTHKILIHAWADMAKLCKAGLRKKSSVLCFDFFFFEGKSRRGFSTLVFF